jgi:hypothetical protein
LRKAKINIIQDSGCPGNIGIQVINVAAWGNVLDQSPNYRAYSGSTIQQIPTFMELEVS